ncbi:alpha-mannosidase [Paenibacillus sp. B2(2019)]|uniref:alpha-mannosidase n=1 Tax=Paenibacillus sp. B2(2019) TaxID=2607754 RepID=UPI0011F0DFB6|nr:alpha-mannosidase [Paenibacillus sp. B2(2019)]KAA1185041.1 alpha-mannosidase [Paenibacillus sp. B2(2019)]
MIRIQRFIRELSERQWLESIPIKDWDVQATEYILPGKYTEERPFVGSDAFDLFPSKQGTTYMLRTTLSIPYEWADDAVGLYFTSGSGGEGLLRINGQSFQGLDRNHPFVKIPARVGKQIEVEIELFDAVPEPVDPLNQQATIHAPIRKIHSTLVYVNTTVQSLMYSVSVIMNGAELLPASDFRRTRVMEALYTAMDAFTLLSQEKIAGGAAASIEHHLVEQIRQIGGNSEGVIHMVGQSHIDIAWLWPCRETVRKTSRTFSTVNALMDEFPEYRYAQSQPLLFEYLKMNDPVLYERVRERIREGRWELVGGMWVEPDLNIPSGESLMRQMLYGQRFYQQEFGKRSFIEWLPDTFGYCASLPQILKHGGMRYFMTTKLNWNDTNPFPYDLFYWVGIDGTPLLSYCNHGVNEDTQPKDVHEHWQSYREKANHPEQMLLYGHGDGGGGVTREMLEYIHRSDLMIGQPTSQFSSAEAFFTGVSEANPNLPSWHGDLYLELHRGTYTTHGRNKRNNRKAEVLYREAELWSTLARSSLSVEQATTLQQDLHEGWKLILLNQFHDIIPGSAITETYETSMKEYVEVFERGTASLQTGMAAIATNIQIQGTMEGTPFLVLNSLGWSRDCVLELTTQDLIDQGVTNIEWHRLSIVTTDGESLDYEVSTYGTTKILRIRVPNVPAMGYNTILVRENEVTVVPESPKVLPALLDVWETAYYCIRFNEQGEIISLYDKQANREIVKAGERANQFHFFHDRPTLWDAWDIDPRYEQQSAGEAFLLEKKLISSGAVADVIGFRWRIGQSTIEQEMVLYHHHARIEFRTKVDWQEAHKLLKVGFPLDVVTSRATYEIPFGALERNTHRNTSWDQAQYEVCGHRFADVSEHSYGVSVLNDCKYGYDTQGSTIRLSLLRAPRWPDISADQGYHEFTYALYPHAGDWRQGHTLRAAAELNHPPAYIAASTVDATELQSTNVWDRCCSLLPFTSEHVVLETVKWAEDDDGIILRMYESAGGRETIELKWPYPHQAVYVSNALEEEVMLMDSWQLTFTPYEIKTIKIKTV